LLARRSGPPGNLLGFMCRERAQGRDIRSHLYTESHKQTRPGSHGQKVWNLWTEC
jgi:hypothetical protein